MLKKLLFVAAIAASGPIAAQSISLQDAGLDINGNRVVNVLYNTDADGGAAGLELGFITGSATTFVSGSVTTTGEGGGNLELPIPAFNPFTLAPTSGLSVDPSLGYGFFAYGTGVLPGATSLQLTQLTFLGPNASVGVVGSFDSFGDYSTTLPGSHGLVGQVTGNTAVAASGSFGAGGGVIDYPAVQVEYEFPFIGLPRGDISGDANVDSIDYAIWRETLNSTTNLVADLNQNGTVDTVDFDIWVEDRLATLPIATKIPEPSAISILILLITARKMNQVVS